MEVQQKEATLGMPRGARFLAPILADPRWRSFEVGLPSFSSRIHAVHCAVQNDAHLYTGTWYSSRAVLY